MSQIKNSGLYQYAAEPFEQQQFRTAGNEGVKVGKTLCKWHQSDKKRHRLAC